MYSKIIFEKGQIKPIYFNFKKLGSTSKAKEIINGTAHTKKN